MTISRDAAKLARDAAHFALRAAQTHAEECRLCNPVGAAPTTCNIARYFGNVAKRLVGEAREALTEYAPKGTRVIYKGMHDEFHGGYTVDGPALQAPWGSYHLTRADGQILHAAPLDSIHLNPAEIAERDRVEAVRVAAGAVLQILAMREMRLMVGVVRRDDGTVAVSWSTLDYFRHEVRAQTFTDDETRQYLAAALNLLRTLRVAAQRDQRDEVKKITDNARTILHRLSLRRNTPRV